MLELDDKFFNETGINLMPETEREEFKIHIREEIETRIGERIADGMPVEKLEEFELIIDGDSGFIQDWIAANSPNYKSDDLYQTMASANQGVDDRQLMSDYAGMKWVQLNRPDFPQIMSSVVEQMKKEIKENIDKIIK